MVGGTATKLSGSLTPGGSVISSPYPSLTPDGSRLIFLADALVDERIELFSVPVGGGTIQRLNPTLLAGDADWDVIDYRTSGDSARAVFTFRSKGCAGCALVDRAYTAAVTGGAAVRLDGCGNTLENVVRVPIPVPDPPKAALYVADQDVNGQFDLYLGDTCLFCNGFEGGALLRWSEHLP
jgi:hypothetical protein